MKWGKISVLVGKKDAISKEGLKDAGRQKYVYHKYI